MKAPLRCGVIGCGFFAQNHLHAWAAMADVRLAAVCDLDGDKARAAAHRFAVPHCYTSAAELLASGLVDFVDIVTVMDSHRALVELSAAHSTPAIVQKPFAPTLEDAAAMVDACERANVPLMVHENFRWQTPLRAVREVVDAGEIGEPFFGRVSFRHGNPVGYENQPYLYEQDEYIINDVGVHLLDLVRYYFGEARQVYAQTQRVNQRFRGEDVATMLLRHASGATSIADLSVSTRCEPDPFPQTLARIEGTHGTVDLGQDYTMRVTSNGAARVEDVSPPAHPWGEAPWEMVQDSVVNIQRHWTDCLLAGRAPDTSGADNYRSLALVFAAYESARCNAPVMLD